MKIKNILLAITLCATTLSGCQSGIVWDEVPESVYSELDMGVGLVRNRPRELFVNKVWQVNHNDGKGQWLENYIARSQLSSYETGMDYVNNTGSNVKILDKVLAPGEKMVIKNKLEIVDDKSAPEGKKYIAHIFTFDKVKYHTPNKGHLFVKSAFDKETVKPYAFVEEVQEGKFRYIVMPVKQTEMVLEFIMEDIYACKVEPVNGAPALGTPGDYTKAQQYLVINRAIRPKGVPEYRRLYEVRVHMLEVTVDEAVAHTICSL